MPNGITIPASGTSAFTVNIGAGKYASTTGNINVEIVNKTLKDWSSMGSERFVRIPMVGGVRYDIQLESYENTSYARTQLYWFSPSQPKQIIPSERLYPSQCPGGGRQPHQSHRRRRWWAADFPTPIAGSNGGTVTHQRPAGLADVERERAERHAARGREQATTRSSSPSPMRTARALPVLNLHVDQNTGSVTRRAMDWCDRRGVAGIPGQHIPRHGDRDHHHLADADEFRRTTTGRASAATSPRRSRGITTSGWPRANRPSSGFPTITTR